VGLHEASQLKERGDQSGKIVRRAVEITRVEFSGRVIRFFRDGFQSGSLKEM
jgi:hypothetical protein